MIRSDGAPSAMAQTLRQAAVIPMADGRVCLVTSSSGKRWVVPKGMIDPGHSAGEAALNEAWEEAGLAGVLAREPAGSYVYEKYGRAHHVLVYVMTVTDEAVDWPRRPTGSRSRACARSSRPSAGRRSPRSRRPHFHAPNGGCNLLPIPTFSPPCVHGG